uniref:Uncharacterized protein n=1 Tax=Rhizophora mucronata TaxID=61149 RepID=A0A2P2P4E5_RHIMU
MNFVQHTHARACSLRALPMKTSHHVPLTTKEHLEKIRHITYLILTTDSKFR